MAFLREIERLTVALAQARAVLTDLDPNDGERYEVRDHTPPPLDPSWAHDMLTRIEALKGGQHPTPLREDVE